MCDFYKAFVNSLLLPEAEQYVGVYRPQTTVLRSTALTFLLTIHQNQRPGVGRWVGSGREGGREAVLILAAAGCRLLPLVSLPLCLVQSPTPMIGSQDNALGPMVGILLVQPVCTR